MKTTKIKITAAFVIFISLNSAFAQRDRREDFDSNDDNHYKRNYQNNQGYNNQGYNNQGNNNQGYNNLNYRNDDDRIRDYQRGQNDYRRNPYDYRNLPSDWDRQRSGRFDWYKFDWENQYDPRYSSRDYYDSYFPWDPNNPYDIRNQRNYYGNNQYWNGSRPNRIVIVPPMFGSRNYGWPNRNRGNHFGLEKRRW